MDVTEIGLDENYNIVLKGSTKSGLNAQEYHSMIIPPLDIEYEQLISLIEGSPNLENSFIRTVLDATEEEVNNIERFTNSKYILQKLNFKKSGEMSPVLTEIGLIYGLIDKANISSEINLSLEDIMEKEKIGMNNEQEFNEWLKTIDFQSINELPKTKSLNKQKINKKKYNEVVFEGLGNLSYNQITQVPANLQFIQDNKTQNAIILIPELKETTEKILVYLGKTPYIFVAPDEGIIHKKILETSQKKEMSLGEKNNYNNWLNRFKYEKYGCLGITKEIINRTDYKPESVYLEAELLETLENGSNNPAALLRPLDSTITLEKNNETITFGIPGNLGVGFGYLYDPCTVYLDEKNIKIQGRKIDEPKPYDGMYA